MSKLAADRSVFHSEADFQHAFAWRIHKFLPDASISLERPYKTDSGILHLDMLIQTEGHSLAVELKYKTLKLDHTSAGDTYQLSNHSAQDIGRYDYIKDIFRIETITRSIPKCTGWAILLTNDSTYWKVSKRSNTVDSGFRLAEGTTLQGARIWGEKASSGTKKNRDKPIILEKSYLLNWDDYSTVSSNKNGQFRYLAIEAKNDG